MPALARGPFKMGTIAKLSGFAPALLRAWERRHGLLEPQRGPGGHRMYTDDDLLVLQYVKSQLDRGRSIGEVAVAGRPALLARAQAGEVAVAAAPAEPLPVAIEDPGPSATAAPGDDLVEMLVDAAVQIDVARIEAALDQTFARYSMEGALDAVLIPAAHTIGDLWGKGEATVASEHVLSRAMVFRVQKLIDIAAAPSSLTPHVLCSCFPDEEHQLGLLIETYRLVRRGLRVGYLGQALPFDDLCSAVERRRPRVVLLSVTLRENYERSRGLLPAAVARMGMAGRVFVGGLGVPGEDPEIEQAGVRLFGPDTPHEFALQQVVAIAKPT